MSSSAETVDADVSLHDGTDLHERHKAAIRDRLVRPMPADRVWGWVATAFVGAVAAVLRIVNLGRPDRLVFDETYYAKDAFSLLMFGDARQFVEDADDLVNAGETDVFMDEPSFVVHPPAGKWLIAIGIRLFGMEPFGWRIAVALAGVATAMIVVRAGRRLFRSTLLGGIAGLLIAVDGMAIATSRIALLDGIVTMFIVAAFACLLIDRDHSRQRYAAWAAAAIPGDHPSLGPLFAWRPWRLTAGVMLGLACATKWNGVFALAVFGVMTVLWDVGARKAAGAQMPWGGALLRDGPAAFVTMVPTALVVYVASWAGWIVRDDGYGRRWAETNDASGAAAALPDWVRSLWHYHAEIQHFHTNLSSEHPYESQPWGWLVQQRPVLFDYISLESGEQGCEVAQCSQTILALGNPILWWGGCLAFLICAWMWLVKRDWRPGAVLAGLLATWVPWLLFLDRTTFSFYAVTIVPFVTLAIAYVIGLLIGPRDAGPTRRTVGAAVGGAYVLCVVALAAWFYPIHIDAVIPYDEWVRRMWFSTWI